VVLVPVEVVHLVEVACGRRGEREGERDRKEGKRKIGRAGGGEGEGADELCALLDWVLQTRTRALNFRRGKYYTANFWREEAKPGRARSVEYRGADWCCASGGVEIRLQETGVDTAHWVHDFQLSTPSCIEDEAHTDEARKSPADIGGGEGRCKLNHSIAQFKHQFKQQTYRAQYMLISSSAVLVSKEWLLHHRYLESGLLYRLSRRRGHSNCWSDA
jgi:hypothetical protein